MRVSACCQSRFTEEPTEIDGKECAFVCATCHLECKLKDINVEDSTPRTEEQAYEDGMKDDLPGAEPPKDVKKPILRTTEVKDGNIYENGKLIGRTLSDREWYKQEFGTEFEGADDTLSRVRKKAS